MSCGVIDVHESRVHWLAEQDIPFARRAVEKLRELTNEVREVAE